jgi:hypothetical protein
MTEEGRAIAGFSRWLRIPPERLAEMPAGDASDAFLMDLDPTTLFRILDARTRKDFPLLRSHLGKAWPNKDEAREAQVARWLAQLERQQ